MYATLPADAQDVRMPDGDLRRVLLAAIREGHDLDEAERCAFARLFGAGGPKHKDAAGDQAERMPALRRVIALELGAIRPEAADFAALALAYGVSRTWLDGTAPQRVENAQTLVLAGGAQRILETLFALHGYENDPRASIYFNPSPVKPRRHDAQAPARDSTPDGSGERPGRRPLERRPALRQ